MGYNKKLVNCLAIIIPILKYLFKWEHQIILPIVYNLLNLRTNNLFLSNKSDKGTGNKDIYKRDKSIIFSIYLFPHLNHQLQ